VKWKDLYIPGVSVRVKEAAHSLFHRKVTLMLSTNNKKNQNKLHQQLGGWDIELISSTRLHEAYDKVVDGLLLADGVSGTECVRVQTAQIASNSSNSGQGIPFLVLLYGGSEAIPMGMADELHHHFRAHPVEVVRFFLMANGERAVIGGDADGYWVSYLRRLAARHGIISLVCQRAEVDEMVYQLARYLRFKQRFFLQMAGRYENGSVRLDLITQALGMDERIGQGWLYHDKEMERWLQNKMKAIVRRCNPLRVVICGYGYQINSLSEWLKQHDPLIETCAYFVDNEEKPKEEAIDSQVCHDFPNMLEQAELLIIAASDSQLQELHLDQVRQQMKHPVVIDAHSLFPVDEAEKFGITYVTYGQNTNDRNENYTGRK
jgi:hypothetical protein